MWKGQLSGGGGTIIGPRDVGWFGNGGVKGGHHPDAAKVSLRQANPLTADAQRRIGNLRVDIAGLERQLTQLDQEREELSARLDDSRGDLASLLDHHGLPLDPGLTARQVVRNGPSTKTTRHQRRKKNRKKQ